MSDELLGTRECARSYALEDMTVRSDGDGRVVEAFAAVFDTPAEVRDMDGHYNEILAARSFTKTIAERGTNFGVFYNHAKTLYGTPDGNLSVPIGVPLEVDQNERGVYTATRYLDNPLADAVLDGIKQRAIKRQSFTGRFVKSTRSRAYSRSTLPTITRSEVAMKEYGPTVFPVYAEAMILGTRSVSSFVDEIAALDPEDVERLRNMLGLATPLGAGVSSDTTTVAVPSDEPPNGHSARHSHRSLRLRAREMGVL